MSLGDESTFRVTVNGNVGNFKLKGVFASYGLDGLPSEFKLVLFTVIF